MADFRLSVGQKFAVLAIANLYADEEEDHQLSDGTWVLNRVPVAIQEHWVGWVGTLRADRMRQANAVLVRALDSNNPTIAGDVEQLNLTQHLNKLFSMLQLHSVPEYGEADLLAGAVLEDGANIRHMAVLPKFHQTKGYLRTPVNIARLEAAAGLRASLEQMERLSPVKFSRLIRGLNALKDGLLQETGQERLHQFVRSLEALVLPAVGSTKSQFAHRCQTFAKASVPAKAILQEAYDMRSDAEHVQDWNRALQAYPTTEREDVALHRTRQMEHLATTAYSKILEDKTLSASFEDDTSQEAFWKLTEGQRITAWGKQLDLTTIPLVRKYDGFNRAA